MKRLKYFALAFVMVFAVVSTACGKKDDSPDDTTVDNTPVDYLAVVTDAFAKLEIIESIEIEAMGNITAEYEIQFKTQFKGVATNREDNPEYKYRRFTKMTVSPIPDAAQGEGRTVLVYNIKFDSTDSNKYTYTVVDDQEPVIEKVEIPVVVFLDFDKLKDLDYTISKLTDKDGQARYMLELTDINLNDISPGVAASFIPFEADGKGDIAMTIWIDEGGTVSNIEYETEADVMIDGTAVSATVEMGIKIVATGDDVELEIPDEVTQAIDEFKANEVTE